MSRATHKKDLGQTPLYILLTTEELVIFILDLTKMLKIALNLTSD